MSVTIADICAAMRNYSNESNNGYVTDYGVVLKDMARFADRIEAAHKREIATITADRDQWRKQAMESKTGRRHEMRLEMDEMDFIYVRKVLLCAEATFEMLMTDERFCEAIRERYRERAKMVRKARAFMDVAQKEGAENDN